MPKTVCANTFFVEKTRYNYVFFIFCYCLFVFFFTSFVLFVMIWSYFTIIKAFYDFLFEKGMCYSIISTKGVLCQYFFRAVYIFLVSCIVSHLKLNTIRKFGLYGVSFQPQRSPRFLFFVRGFLV